MQTAALQILRVAAVIALLGAAAAVATPKGRLPLALRGLGRTLRRDGAAVPRGERVPVWRRALALALAAAAAMAAAL